MMPNLFSVFSVAGRFAWFAGLAAVWAVQASGVPSPQAAAAAADRPNVLFIAIDDMRNQAGAYGDADMHTPNMDRLAASGVVFDRHYVQNPICIPSRICTFTSSRPERTHQTYGPYKWQDHDGLRPIGKTFGGHGYKTISLGKIWHGWKGTPTGDSFDVKWGLGHNHYYASEEFDGRHDYENLPATEGPVDVPDNAYADGMVADRAIRELRKAEKDERPFMMAVGFYKPHLPFNAPAKYWKPYDREDPPGEAERLQPPEGMADHAPREKHQLWMFNDGWSLDNPPTGADERLLRHAYAACVSYVDAQIGRVLDELERLGVADNTIVVLWSDHGYHLRHLGMWTKHTNFETAARSPLIVSSPDSVRGEHSDALVESVDIFPTLLELCGLPPLQLSDGTSFAHLLDDPDASFEDAAFHVVERWVPQADKPYPRLVVGRAIRTDRYRYVEWQNGWKHGEPIERELYEYADDLSEARNLVNDPSYADVVKELSRRLWEWREYSHDRR